MSKGLAVYIHWPFCISKCPYCDFNSRPIGDGVDESAWAEAYGRELEHYAAQLSGREVGSVYFGGGTPSLMHPRTVAALMNKIAALWPLKQKAEVTIEANPSASEIEKFRAFKEAGVNRISIGVQALDDAALRFLGRAHDKNAAREAIESAQQVFDRFSFDLIYARAEQTTAAWAEELQHALSFGAQHLSLYQLTIEEGTPFFKRAAKEKLAAEEEVAAEMYEATQAIMADAGLPAYEISNYATPGQESRHNLTYWRYDDYIGIGPGAHGRFVGDDGQRLATENHRKPEAWLQQTVQQKHGCVVCDVVGVEAAKQEALMMGLRLVEGIDRTAWRRKFGGDVAQHLDAGRLQECARQGWLEITEDALRTTHSGRQRLNALLGYLG